MLDRLTICLTYYRNPEMLREQQRVIAGYPADIRSRVSVVVVDDGSPEERAEDALTEPDGYELRLYRVTKDIPWGHRAARNLATHHAAEGWMLVTDIDHTLPLESAERLFAADLFPWHYYIPGRRLPNGGAYHPHPNSYILERALYWDRVGGSSEAFNGYYGGDGPFRKRVSMYGNRVEMPEVQLCVYNLGGNDLTDVPGCATRAWGRKNTPWHSREHPKVKALMAKAHSRRPENVLQFEWSRVR